LRASGQPAIVAGSRQLRAVVVGREGPVVDGAVADRGVVDGAVVAGAVVDEPVEGPVTVVADAVVGDDDLLVEEHPPSAASAATAAAARARLGPLPLIIGGTVAPAQVQAWSDGASDLHR
jgi:hypothetical protein